MILAKGTKLTAIHAKTFASIPISIIEIPTNIEVIEANAFRGCSSLTTVTFEEGAHLNTIKGGSDASGAFAHCTSLTSIEIPACFETIEASVFRVCI